MFGYILLIGLLIYSLFILFWVSSAFSAFFRTRVPFIPSKESDIQTAVVLGDIGKDDIVLDLGSGNGRVVFLFEKFAGAQGFGIETGLWMHWYAQLRAKYLHSNATFVCGNIFKESWSDATAIYSYLYPPLMGKVEEKFLKDCNPGTKLIVKDFKLPNLTPIKDQWLSKNHRLSLYIHP